MKQYEVWWAELPAPVGRRPVLLLSRNAAYEFLSRILVVEITTTLRGIAQELALSKRDGLPARCVANFDNLHQIPRAALERRVCSLSSRVVEIKKALGYTVAWPELTLPE
ncbi:MAG: type II toxin-antitoxin system PemK/MazF family toxin [Myxococcaceae bacterium]